jgi:hypothetical protein
MIDKVLSGILGEIRPNFLLCHRVDRLGPIPGFRPPLQPASKIVRMKIRSLLFGCEKAIKSFFDAQNLSGSFDMVRYELDAPRQRPAHRQKIDRLDGVPAVLFVHTGSEFSFPGKQCFRSIPFKLGSSLRAEMPAPSTSVNELVSLPDWVSLTTTMLDFVDLPCGPLRHGDANNTHKTHTAMIFAVSPRTVLGFLKLKSGSNSRRGQIHNVLVDSNVGQL